MKIVVEFDASNLDYDKILHFTSVFCSSYVAEKLTLRELLHKYITILIKEDQWDQYEGSGIKLTSVEVI